MVALKNNLTVLKVIKPNIRIMKTKDGFAPTIFTTFSVEAFSLALSVTSPFMVSEVAILLKRGVVGSSITEKRISKREQGNKINHAKYGQNICNTTPRYNHYSHVPGSCPTIIILSARYQEQAISCGPCCQTDWFNPPSRSSWNSRLNQQKTIRSTEYRTGLDKTQIAHQKTFLYLKSSTLLFVRLTSYWLP